MLSPPAARNCGRGVPPGVLTRSSVPPRFATPIVSTRVPVATSRVALERPSAGRLALCGADGDVDDDGMLRTTSAVQAPSTTAAMASSAASEPHLVRFTVHTIRDRRPGPADS